MSNPKGPRGASSSSSSGDNKQQPILFYSTASSAQFSSTAPQVFVSRRNQQPSPTSSGSPHSLAQQTSGTPVAGPQQLPQPQPQQQQQQQQQASAYGWHGLQQMPTLMALGGTYPSAAQIMHPTQQNQVHHGGGVPYTPLDAAQQQYLQALVQQQQYLQYQQMLLQQASLYSLHCQQQAYPQYQQPYPLFQQQQQTSSQGFLTPLASLSNSGAVQAQQQQQASNGSNKSASFSGRMPAVAQTPQFQLQQQMSNGSDKMPLGGVPGLPQTGQPQQQAGGIHDRTQSSSQVCSSWQSRPRSASTEEAPAQFLGVGNPAPGNVNRPRSWEVPQQQQPQQPQQYPLGHPQEQGQPQQPQQQSCPPISHSQAPPAQQTPRVLISPRLLISSQRPLPQRNSCGVLDRSSLPEEIKRGINMFQLEGYAQHYFRTVRKGIFKRTVPVRELLVWSKSDLDRGLLRHAKRSTHQAATKLFRNIQRYMGDREVKSVQKSGDALAHIIAIEVDRTPELRDEAYIQVCKQTTQNPSAKSNRLGWELLVILSNICCPTKDLETHLLAYLNFYLTWHDQQIHTMAQYCLQKLAQRDRPASLHRTIALQEIARFKMVPFQTSWFGSTLQAQMEMKVTSSHPPADVPAILPALIRAIEMADGFHAEGLFRISGDGTEVGKLRAQVDGGDLTFSPKTSPHDLASLLKYWLRELPTALIVPELYQAFLDQREVEASLCALVDRLPSLHKKVLLRVLCFLQKLSHPEYLPATKMPASNLALIFSPLFLRCTSDNAMVLLENTRLETSVVTNLLKINWSSQ